MEIYLNGIWHIRDSEREFDFFGKVPGTVQGDLIELGKLPHPYIGTNELLFERLEKKDWVYEREFYVEKIQEDMRYELVFKGVDTLSSVHLNGKLLGNTENMFIEYRFDITDILKQGKNSLKVVIASPIERPKALMKTYGELAATGEHDVRPYIRKAQYSYGWDWGARIVTSGIWRDVFIEVLPDARLYGSTAYLSDMETIEVTGYIDKAGDDIDVYKVSVLIDGKPKGEFGLNTTLRGPYFKGRIKRDGLSLWWPSGMGEPTLHDFIFILLKDGKEVYRERKKIGLRKVEILKKDDEKGETFIFQINGKTVFAKGANWIPAENILSWLTKKDYEELVQMAYDANMNMLRIWGGGIYEDEAFYEKCDELGIMIWQDFMFACAEYPDHISWFRELANREVRENIIALRHHPSIVLWCGNNENNWGFDEWPHFAHKVDGKFLGNTLYLEDFPKICAEEDPSRPYWPSSPFGGSRPNAEDGGDRHNWDVWSGWQDYTEYKKDRGKFLSEFGFQAAPDPKTIAFFAKPWEKEIFSKTMVLHNKQVEGPERIMKFIHNHFGLVSDFEAIIYLSQINQAEAIKEGVEHWRSRKYSTAGTLYWQLNDSWPVFSWSAIDYFKRPKALYYYTKRFYKEILPVCIRNENGAILKIINDGKDIVGKLEVFAYDIQSGEKLFERIYKDVRVGEDSVVFVDDLSFSNIWRSILFMKFVTDKGIYENDKLLTNLRDISPKDPKLNIEEGGNHIIITAKYPAYGVYVVGEGVEDNFFSLVPEMPKAIRIEEMEKVVSIYDLLKK